VGVITNTGDGVIVIVVAIDADVVGVITAAVGVVAMIANVIDVVIVGTGVARVRAAIGPSRMGGVYAIFTTTYWGDGVVVITLVAKAVTVRTANIYAVVVSTRVGSNTVVTVRTVGTYGVGVSTRVVSGTCVATIAVGVCR
jgi:hypothetical protein